MPPELGAILAVQTARRVRRERNSRGDKWGAWLFDAPMTLLDPYFATHGAQQLMPSASRDEIVRNVSEAGQECSIALYLDRDGAVFVQVSCGDSTPRTAS